MMSMNLSNITILNIHGVGYHYFISTTSKSEAKPNAKYRLAINKMDEESITFCIVAMEKQKFYCYFTKSYHFLEPTSI